MSISYKEYLEEYGILTYTNVGVSMLPLLRQGEDLMIVSRKWSRRCRVGDVVLYTRADNKYVLHRIIKVRANDYVIMGDNCVSKEYGIRDDDILGVMTGLVRGGRKHSTSERGYRVYTFIILHTIGMRVFIKRCKSMAVRCVKKVLGARRGL